MPVTENLHFNHNHYVPVVKWRQGEYQALWRLSESVKDWITPLFEIPTEPWDFELEEAAKTLDEHLDKFGTRLSAKWGARLCFIDSCYIDGAAQMATGIHHLEFLFEAARNAGAFAVPVVGLGRLSDYLDAARAVIEADQRGVCVRLTSDDFTPTLVHDLTSLLTNLGLSANDAHLVLDIAEDMAGSPVSQGLVWKALLTQTPWLTDWRSVTVVGTAFPATLPAAQFRPHGLTPRTEWTAYHHLFTNIDNLRIPTFGDYTVSHPRTELLDPRLLDPNAKIKYTVDGEWYVQTGTQVKKYGRAQYQALCQQLVANPLAAFPGADYSWGDSYIVGCATGTEGTGGTSTWPSVANNHHLTKVVRDIATLFGASAIP
ncbi:MULTISPECIES: beta family protein [Ralstonia solanacearum species complex]|uniref:beta family protein n=1 Tax=Ralstonia solanacearum species complex TaxID=3116862 RepID=UPI0009E48C9C|nr:beta family protein [Ralstonia pseudosolanacearum]MCK4123782.1 hypothetical protein [Ralstonia pseudosolanacearum]